MNLFKLPTPVELGMSKYNSLASRNWNPDCEGPTWEDYDLKVKQLYPIKYFIIKTLGDFLSYKIWLPIKNPISETYYWFVSHVIPSKRYHMLDLRQPCIKGDEKNFHCYRYGWADVSSKMLYAMFNLLGEFLNKEKPHDLTQFYSREEINADVGMKMQQDAIDEARDIYHWWMVSRRESEKIYSQLLTDWSNARTNKSVNSDRLWKLLQFHETEMDNKTEEMILRLVKIRQSLWT